LARRLARSTDQLPGLRDLPDQPRVRALHAAPAVLHALPWERTLPTGVEVFRAPGRAGGRPAALRRAQLALGELGLSGVAADGLEGPATAAALERFQRERGLAVTGAVDPATMRALLVSQAVRAGGKADGMPVLVVRPPQRASKEARRGFAISGMSPEQAYAGWGVTVRVVETTRAEAIQGALRDWRPVIVHVCAGFVDARGTPALDLAPGQHEYQIELLFPTVVERLVATSLPLPPLVVLDVPAPPTPEEAMVQLLLRNAFAAELTQRGKLEPVLATGLVEPFEQPAFHHELRSGFTAGTSVGELAACLRGRGGAPDTALFTTSPGWLVPTPG
jgi:hypothetical protein